MIKQMVNYWSSYLRKFVNIQKAVYNPEVNELFVLHYHYLHSLLVKAEQDEDTFNDTYLKLTYNYDSSKDFIELFKYYFNLLKGAYQRDDKTANYYLSFGNDLAQLNYSEDDSEEDMELIDTTKPQLKKSLSELKQSIKQYVKLNR